MGKSKYVIQELKTFKAATGFGRFPAAPESRLPVVALSLLI